ncbi:DNA-directed RNA polymerases I and III subunit RPAC1-like isoform X2 [Corticium candelabrum]|uniref:DNA-directed RNA polymerases I and III subunit RPAC1-like isoform X2 n=1 Tax=Corticium candelabrum TaxID=121492 RepID=UPI002E27456E|nr:DNA-directed RNA polymerases I and III subunit RPAC1-like isoform X2 [Corticium candelabrum]
MARKMDEIRTRIELKSHNVENASTTDYPGNYVGYDDSWSLEKFKKKFRVNIIHLTDNEMEFDMVGIDASLANAFRRILLAEVPTMAIEKVYMFNNTSVIQDEVLAHRLGLIPIYADPEKFEFPSNNSRDGGEKDMIAFTLNVKCSKNSRASKTATDPTDLYLHSNVTSADLKWCPIGRQAEMFSPNEIRPVHDDILIAKLRPGQEINMKVHCFKGIAQDHAKFSPVCTASYRLLPEIVLTSIVEGDKAERLSKCFSSGVIEIEEVNGVKRAKVVNPRLDTCSREVLRHDDLKDCVRLHRVRDHFIFLVESTGAMPPEVIVSRAIRLLEKKCSNFLFEMDKPTTDEDEQ